MFSIPISNFPSFCSSGFPKRATIPTSSEGCQRDFSKGSSNRILSWPVQGPTTQSIVLLKMRTKMSPKLKLHSTPSIFYQMTRTAMVATVGKYLQLLRCPMHRSLHLVIVYCWVNSCSHSSSRQYLSARCCWLATPPSFLATFAFSPLVDGRRGAYRRFPRLNF